MKPSIFIVGNFFDNRRGMPTTQAEELKKILERNGIRVLSASRHIDRLPRLIGTLFCLLRYSRQYKIVNIHFYGGFALILEGLATFLCRLLGKTILLTLHGGAIPDMIKKKPFWYKLVLRQATLITCPSPYLIHHLKPLNLPVQLIENSLPLKAYKFHPKQSFGPTLLWMRSFHPIYNPEMALNVVSLLKQDYPNLRLFMAGVDLGHFEQTRAQAKKMGIENKVVFPGYLDTAAKNHLTTICDIYICTNRVDNTPVSLLEMMALGLPVITTGVGGIPFMIQNGEALLVATEDAPAMASAIRRLIAEPELGQQLVHRGLQLVQRYDEETVVQKWLAIFKGLGNQPQSKASHSTAPILHNRKYKGTGL